MNEIAQLRPQKKEVHLAKMKEQERIKIGVFEEKKAFNNENGLRVKPRKQNRLCSRYFANELTY